MFKGFTTEGGIRAPAIISAKMLKKAHLQGTLNRDTVHVMDLMPTMLDLAGVSLGKTFHGRPVQTISGKSMRPLLEGQSMGERQIGWELFGRKALRKGDWKITLVNKPYGNADWQLYNLKIDPTESQDLASNEPAKLKEMLLAWNQYAKENNVLDGKFELKYGFKTCLYEYCFK
ncbi:Arylsulfatase [compost metagenome]